MDRLDNLALFVTIVEKGGLAAAGREHGLSPASVSERLTRLESDYGARLLNRTTRSVSPTEAGRTLLDGARHLVAEAEELAHRVRTGTARLSGTVRLSAPIDLGRSRVAPLLDEMLREHTDLRVDLQLCDGRVDLVERGLDLAVRYGALADSSLVVRTLASGSRQVCASPAYLEAHGTPAHPDELAGHECLTMRFGDELDDVWSFRVDGKAYPVRVGGRRVADDGRLVRQWCLAGCGLALKSWLDTEADVAAGRLITCLGEFGGAPSPLQVIYPSSSRQPARVRLVIDRLIEAFRSGAHERPPLPPAP